MIGTQVIVDGALAMMAAICLCISFTCGILSLFGWPKNEEYTMLIRIILLCAAVPSLAWSWLCMVATGKSG